jgi:hypothetical protein
MVTLLGIIAGIALVLAVVVAGLFIGVCVLINWLTGGGKQQQQPGTAQRKMRGRPGLRPPMRQPQSRHRAGSNMPRMPTGPRHGNR